MREGQGEVIGLVLLVSGLDLFYNSYMERNLKGQFIKGTNGTTFEGFGVYSDSKGYPCIWLDGRSVRIHVFLWERVNGPKPLRHVIHHKDHDKSNYSLANLQLVTESDHRRIHAGWVQENNEWTAKPCTKCHRVLPLTSFYARVGHTPTALCKPCFNQVSAARNRTIPERRRIYNQRWYAKRKGVMPNAAT